MSTYGCIDKYPRLVSCCPCGHHHWGRSYFTLWFLREADISRSVGLFWQYIPYVRVLRWQMYILSIDVVAMAWFRLIAMYNIRAKQTIRPETQNKWLISVPHEELRERVQTRVWLDRNVTSRCYNKQFVPLTHLCRWSWYICSQQGQKPTAWSCDLVFHWELKLLAARNLPEVPRSMGELLDRT